RNCEEIAVTAEAALTQAALTPLEGAHYISLTTFRKNDVAVATPVWFAAHDATLYVYTGAETGKVKRLRHTARVTLAPCTMRGEETGPTIIGNARIIT